MGPGGPRVDDTGEAWRVFYDNRIYVETRAARHALAGNLPLLADKRSGTVVVDETWQPWVWANRQPHRQIRAPIAAWACVSGPSSTYRLVVTHVPDPDEATAPVVDGRVVGAALNDAVRPLLKSAGFTRFAGRTAWRDSEFTVDFVNFRSFTRYLADGMGCTTYSFTGDVGVFYRCLGPDQDRPKDYELTFRATLGKTLSQPLFRRYARSVTTDRPDVWFITEDGRTLADCVADARECLVAQGLPFLDKFAQPQRAFESLRTERSTDTRFGEPGITMPGNPDSSVWRNAALAIGHLFLDDPRSPMRSAPVLQRGS